MIKTNTMTDKKFNASFLLCFTSLAEATLISSTIISNDFTAESGWDDNNLINQSGLNANYIDGVTTLSEYMALPDTSSLSPSTSNDHGYFAYSSPGSIIFDLGQTYALDNFLLWNDTDTQGINSFTLSISDDVTFTTPSGIFNYNATVGDVDGGSSYGKSVPLQIFGAGASSGQYVQLSINSLHRGSDVNFGEVAFDVSSHTVPEPSIIALLSLGLVGIGLTRRKA